MQRIFNDYFNTVANSGIIIRDTVFENVDKKLIIHIPEKHFKMIRYYGLYAKNHKHKSSLLLAVPIEKRRFLESLNSWRTSLLLSFGFDPLLCKCGHHNECAVWENISDVFPSQTVF